MQKEFELVGKENIYFGVVSYEIETDEGRMYYPDGSGQPPTSEIINVVISGIEWIDADGISHYNDPQTEEFESLLSGFISDL